MVNKGMSFRLTVHPFTVTGEVGGEVRLHCNAAGGTTIAGREGIYDLAAKLERLGDELSRMHSWEGEWNIIPAQNNVPFSENEDGVLL